MIWDLTFWRYLKCWLWCSELWLLLWRCRWYFPPKYHSPYVYIVFSAFMSIPSSLIIFNWISNGVSKMTSSLERTTFDFCVETYNYRYVTLLPGAAYILQMPFWNDSPVFGDFYLNTHTQFYCVRHLDHRYFMTLPPRTANSRKTTEFKDTEYSDVSNVVR